MSNKCASHACQFNDHLPDEIGVASCS